MKIEDGRPMKIKNWSPEDRPREKFMLKGASALSDAELIAILIGSGTGNFNALDVAKKLLQQVDQHLAQLARLTVRELMKAKGIGEVKALCISAALELGRRRKEEDAMERPKIGGSKDAFQQLAPDMMDLPHEEFWVIVLNRAHRVVRKKKVSEGGVSGTIVDPRIIFKMAIEELASGVIVAHNHPSGNLTASQSDIDLTKRLREAGRFLEIPVLDHLIICGKHYLSFADEGMLS